MKQDYLPDFIADAAYLINLANLKAHAGAGITLCAKNHYGSLVRYPGERGYFDLHRGAFRKEPHSYRPLVELMAHAHFGGKTVLYMIDGLYPGTHTRKTPLRAGGSRRPSTATGPQDLLASQDPVAIDSVGFDFLWTEWADYPRMSGVDDYLNEAAQAEQPPSGTFYDPDHVASVTQPASLGVHEHWNNAEEKKYSRNWGSAKASNSCR